MSEGAKIVWLKGRWVGWYDYDGPNFWVCIVAAAALPSALQSVRILCSFQEAASRSDTLLVRLFEINALKSEKEPCELNMN